MIKKKKSGQNLMAEDKPTCYIPLVSKKLRHWCPLCVSLCEEMYRDTCLPNRFGSYVIYEQGISASLFISTSFIRGALYGVGFTVD